MGLMSAGLSEVLFVYRFDRGALVGFTQFFAFVYRVDAGFSRRPFLGFDASGLAAADDASAGASHDFDEVERFARFDHFHDLSRAVEAARNSNFRGKAFEEFVLGQYVFKRELGDLDLIGSSERSYVQIVKRQLASGNKLINGSQSRFHNAARYAEDIRRAGGKTHNGVEILVGKIYEIYTRLFDHVGKFSCGENSVNVTLHHVRARLKKFLEEEGVAI